VADKAEGELRRLLDIMAALRDPASGCPWDRVQDFDTIAPYTIEEAYEVAEAIGRRDFAALPDELGDLLFQVVYHARMAEEQGRFDFADVAARPRRGMLGCSAWRGKSRSGPSARRGPNAACWRGSRRGSLPSPVPRS
jgi:NTP pyrophosphatase (non-canonical NTP hydrolase)